ncbi:MAG: HAMP domain-containing sensor histidine kinase [Myxococcota bacterium]|nr:HAMP domain-containing sensor histidine kinase [Myxococcota bacterium]
MPLCREIIPLLSSNASLKWRIGLLLTTAVMGAALVISGITSYQTAVRSYRAIGKAEVVSMFMGLRHEFRHPRNHPDVLLEDIFSDLQKRGLSYLAVMDARGAPIFEKGRAISRFASEKWTCARGHRPVDISFVDNGDRLHGVARIRGHRGPAPRCRFLVMEITPVEGKEIVNRAFTGLIIEVGATLFLLGAALVFWRLSRKSEQVASQLERERRATAEQLERDRQLKMLGQMSAVLGHELKNPLTALKGHAQLLTEQLGSDHSGYKWAEIVVAETEYLEQLTNQVLDFAKTGSLKLSTVYLDDLAHAAIAFSKSDPVQIELDDDSAHWVLDRHRMAQVLINLLRNARQSSGSEPISLSIKASDKLTIVVQDRGSGIPKGDEDKIFEPFFTNRATGSGLGLALSKRIVEEHGGRISVENPAQGGAAFIIELPQGTMETDP